MSRGGRAHVGQLQRADLGRSGSLPRVWRSWCGAYLGAPTILAATNKSESFNDFVKWLAFGGGAVIAENDRAEQRKIIKYNHLLANCLIFHKVCTMTRALYKLLRVCQSSPKPS